jgi:hypothetical protein
MKSMPMTSHRAYAAALRAVLVVGLATAYLSPVVGLLGVVDRGTVTIAMLCSLAVAFIAAVCYFATGASHLRGAFDRK